MTKSELRKSYLGLRKSINTNTKLALEAQIFLSLRSNFNLEGLTIHTYLPIKKFGEINTYPLLQDKKSTWLLPVSDFTDNSLKHVLYQSTQQIVVSKQGIPEPISGTTVAQEHIDLVIVPLLITDLKGFRVGYGKGFYDRFLSQLPKNVPKIGLSLFEPVDSIQDINTFDQALTHTITPDNIYAF